MNNQEQYETSAITSYIMSRITAKNTKPEILVRKALFASGFRYTLNNKKLPGSPDIVLKKYCTVIFVNGCFWHGHTNCSNFRPVKNNTEFWDAKIENTKKRDILNEEKLHTLNWNVLTVWECELKKEVVQATLEKLIQKLQNNLTGKNKCKNIRN